MFLTQQPPEIGLADLSSVELGAKLFGPLWVLINELLPPVLNRGSLAGAGRHDRRSLFTEA
jgi:hypothetical protein